MEPQNNILEFDFFKAWNEGELDTKIVLENIEEVNNFTLSHPGVYVGFTTGNDYIRDLFKTRGHNATSQLETIKNGFLGATLNFGCNVFWFSDFLYKKPELRFLKPGYTIMEIKMYDPVQTKVPEPV